MLPTGWWWIQPLALFGKGWVITLVIKQEWKLWLVLGQCLFRDPKYICDIFNNDAEGGVPVIIPSLLILEREVFGYLVTSPDEVPHSCTGYGKQILDRIFVSGCLWIH